MKETPTLGCLCTVNILDMYFQPHGGRFGVGVGGRRTGAATEGMVLPGLETAVRPNSAGGPSPALPVSPSSSGYFSR